MESSINYYQRQITQISLIPNRVEEVVYYNSGLTNKKTNLRYSDGFWRNLASLSSTEIPNQWIRKDMRYDEVGNTIFVSYPYFTDTDRFTNMWYPFGQTNGEKFRIITPWVSYSFDAINRIIVQQDSLGVTRKEYFPKKEKIVNALGKVIDFDTNAYWNIITVREFLESIPKVTSYRYDAQGSMVWFTDALWNIRSWLYDWYGRLTHAEDLHKVDDTTYGIRKYIYNTHNQVMEYTHPSWLSMHYTYDSIWRLKSETGSWLLRTYIYDEWVQSLGTLSLVSDTNSTVSYKYDTIGRKIWEKRIIWDNSYDIFYSYNLQNQPTSITYPDKGIVEYTYINGYVDSINYKSHSWEMYELIKDIAYSPNGAIRSQKYANGMTKIANRDRNHNYRLKRMTIASGSTTFLDTTYEYDGINNISLITVDGVSPIKKNISYSYDDISRLKNAQYNYSDAWYNRDQAQSYSYNYDDIWNTVSSSVIWSYHYWETEYANPHAVTEVGDVNYEYDTAGNIIAQTDSGSSTNFVYSLYGEILSSEKLWLPTTYSYDYTKRRLAKIRPWFIEHHVIDGYEVEYENLPLSDSRFQSLSNSGISTENVNPETIEVADTGGTGSTQESPNVDGISYSVSNFTWLNPKTLITRLSHIMLWSEQIATFQSQTDDQEFTQYDDQLIFHISDYLNSSSLDFSLTWALLQVTDYQPFGQINTYQVTNERVSGMKWWYKNKYLYANKQQDHETDLQYFEKRYYNPMIGKFTTEDPVFWEVWITKRPYQYILDPDQWNTYSYVRNNPINLVDPTGEEVDYSGTHKDSITGNMYYSVNNLSTQDLDAHYKSNNWTSLQVNFSEINTNFIAPTSFTEVSEKILNWKDGEYNILTKQNFTMKDYNAYERFGTISLVLDWKLKIQDNAWSFEGSYKSYDDVYDFTVSPTDIKTFWRTLRNILTIGKSITLWKWTPYDIQIRWEKEISGNWKIKNTIPQWRGWQDKKKIIITND
jgi:RHS repeat-associated protein